MGLEQQLLLDNANLFKRKQLRDLKLQKEKQEAEQKEQMKKENENNTVPAAEVANDKENTNEAENISNQVQEAVDLISGDIGRDINEKKDENKGSVVSVEQVIPNVIDNIQSEPVSVQ